MARYHLNDGTPVPGTLGLLWALIKALFWSPTAPAPAQPQPENKEK